VAGLCSEWRYNFAILRIHWGMTTGSKPTADALATPPSAALCGQVGTG